MTGAAPESVGTSARDQLQAGLSQLDLAVDAFCVDQLLAYLALLHKWNRAYNLTAVREPLAMVRRHLLDSLSIAPWVRGDRVLDVGTGAGLPGIPLALCQPERQFVLLDSNSKKTRFLFQACTELSLPNVRVVHERIERYRPQALFDSILSRAFAPLAQIYQSCAPLLAPGGAVLAMKGAVSDAELSALDRQSLMLSVQPLQVPGLDEQRTLVTLQPAGSTPDLAQGA